MAAAQPHRTAQSVDRLLQSPLKEEIRVGLLSVKLGAKAMERNYADTRGGIGIGEKVSLRGFVAIELGDCKRVAILHRQATPDAGIERWGEELVASRIERRTRECKRSFDSDAGEEALLDADREAIGEARVDGVHRDQTDNFFHAACR